MDARTLVLESALRLFSERGYDAVGVQEIVEGAGVTKPTLYHHFKSKQGLFETLLDERLRPLDEALLAACDYQGDLPLTLERIVTVYLDFATRERAFYQLLLSTYYAPFDNAVHKAAASRLQRHFALVEDVFVRAVRGHGNLRGKQQRLGVSLLGLINSFLPLVWGGQERNDGPLVHGIVKQFSYGIYA
ncbi:MAG TPA: TetR/AcrR family transcriptional regulator [Pantanalinema sp.]